MRKYEMLLLFSPELTTDNRAAVIETLSGIIAREEGVLLTNDDWGMRELAYPVQKQVRGHYTRLEFAAKPTTIAEMERIVRITDGIFKFVTVKLADTFVPAEGA